MIEISRRRILRDGRPALVLAGEVHYFRTARAEWPERIDALREVGCDCVASYIPWLFHELPDGSLDLTGRSRPERDLAAFVDLCADRGLGFLARPGPFVMAELKNEGLPYRLYTEHPQIVPTGWNGVPAPTRTVDYLAPAFLAEVERWYAAVMPILATRLEPAGGPVIGVQLDNEIGMLAWVSNSPDLTDDLLSDFRRWCQGRHGRELAERYPIPLDDPARWRQAVESPRESWAAALRVDLGRFMRDRFAGYVDALADSAGRHGIAGVPFLINIHGTEGGNGVPFAIGVSQLLRTYARPGFVAGSDHYLGELSPGVTADLHFLNAALAATCIADQPLTSLEFEAGNGDYGGNLDQSYDPATVDLKTRLFLAQGNRLINYYLLAGGINPPLEVAAGDGNDRISFTGEQHGVAAPIGPLGQRGASFDATRSVAHVAAANARWLADLDEQTDDLAVGFVPDAFMTEYHHPGSAVMTEIVEDLARYRGPGEAKTIWRGLLFGGFRFGATDLQDPRSHLPRTVVVSTGRVLAADVQRRLAGHLAGGGSLLLVGRLPALDLEGRPCTILAETLRLREGALRPGSASYYPSLVAHDIAAPMAETRTSWLAELSGPGAVPVLTDVEGRSCAVRTTIGPGRAVVATTQLPTRPDLYVRLLDWLGSPPGLGLRTDVPGVVATTGVTPTGERMLHLINPTGSAATAQVVVGDPTGLLDSPLQLPARTGRMLPLGLRLASGGTLVSANAEITGADERTLAMGAGLGGRTEVWLRTTRPISCPTAEIRPSGEMTLVLDRGGAAVEIAFG